jgi:hypothetical protein
MIVRVHIVRPLREYGTKIGYHDRLTADAREELLALFQSHISDIRGLGMMGNGVYADFYVGRIPHG